MIESKIKHESEPVWHPWIIDILTFFIRSITVGSKGPKDLTVMLRVSNARVCFAVNVVIHVLWQTRNEKKAPGFILMFKIYIRVQWMIVQGRGERNNSSNEHRHTYDWNLHVEQDADTLSENLVRVRVVKVRCHIPCSCWTDNSLLQHSLLQPH